VKRFTTCSGKEGKGDVQDAADEGNINLEEFSEGDNRGGQRKEPHREAIRSNNKCSFITESGQEENKSSFYFRQEGGNDIQKRDVRSRQWRIQKPGGLGEKGSHLG